MKCSRNANPITGAPAYPEPEKGEMGQDAELMLAFEICEEFREEQQATQSRRREFSEQVTERLGMQSF